MQQFIETAPSCNPKIELMLMTHRQWKFRIALWFHWLVWWMIHKRYCILHHLYLHLRGRLLGLHRTPITSNLSCLRGRPIRNLCSLQSRRLFSVPNTMPPSINLFARSSNCHYQKNWNDADLSTWSSTCAKRCSWNDQCPKFTDAVSQSIRYLKIPANSRTMSSFICCAGSLNYGVSIDHRIDVRTSAHFPNYLLSLIGICIPVGFNLY